ncbi:V-type ATP synthase subunit F [Limihaloglobus sulfuriphilus]|uniref:V-type ATP synthase subunit F n=1 Tax=Limihaloglobus sulfuriphilus TaxID=1851148 RepID=A0A1Q2MB29_9BACT|nr:V-type ATP synthase subunit F [Limihaloglobus sulfuriphilus]AQQ69738.1 V-type ATP synthase subunit F [Limihaloglobus sulfuriphilus]
MTDANTKNNAAVIGSRDFVMPFSALGLETYPVEPDTDEPAEKARQILEAKYSLVVVAENIAEQTREIFEEIQKDPLPCVVVVPFTTEPEGYSQKQLGRLLKMATGIDILQE